MTNYIMIGATSTVLAGFFLAVYAIQDWTARTPRFICRRCGKKQICYPGLPNECPCGKGREAI